MKIIAKIEITNNLMKNGISFKKGETYFAEILSIGFSGGFERYANNTMEGEINPTAIVHIYQAWPDSNQNAIGLLTSFIIDYHAKIKYGDDVV